SFLHPHLAARNLSLLNTPPTSQLYTLSLHDALPISRQLTAHDYDAITPFVVILLRGDHGHERQALAVPHLCRPFHGGKVERPLSRQPRQRADRADGRLTPAHPDGL